MKITVFYSWQSDLPNNANRSFIQSVIEKAIQTIKRDETFDLDICLDRDTQGEPGSPDIVSTILQKIVACDIFIADISIVTRDLQDGQRFSPNPNVMIELGYAIKSVGWDRIILFCNEIYGTGEKLPFDIQQHRRIGYELNSDDDKTVARDRLVPICRKALTEITESYYKNRKDKLPNLLVDWTKFDYVISEDNRPPIKSVKTPTDMLELTRAKALENIESIEYSIKRELEEVNQIDGSVDPIWKQKVETYTKACDKFIKQMKSKKGRSNYLITINSKHAIKTTINLHNYGSLPASDIRVNVTLPDWILAFDHLPVPGKDEIPKRPEKPVPEIPKDNLAYTYNNRPWMSEQHFIPPFSTYLTKRTSACYIKDQKIIMWADRLNHKHDLTIDDDSFYILAMPNSVLGEHSLKVDIFCVECDDWEEADLFIRIKSNPEETQLK